MKPPTKKHENKESKEQEYLAGWKRARADLENFQKRLVDTREQERAAMKRSFAASLVSLNDNFRSLLEHAPQTKDPWIEGVLHIARQFDQTLQEFGVETIDEAGKQFDPAIHEAVAEVDGEESGTVVEVVQVGYKIGDTVIRPAKVKVTAWQSSPTEIGDPDNDVDSRLRGNDNNKS